MNRKVIFSVVIILTLAASVSIYVTISKTSDISFPWDSAEHAWEGLIIASDIKAGDLVSFLGDTYRQGWWPFLHSWLLAPAFMIFGNTYAVARLVSLLCVTIFVLIVYRIGLKMHPNQGIWIGLIVVCLCLTSRPYLVLSAMCMSEVPGMLMTFITFFLYLKAINEKSNYFYLCTSFFLAITLFTKWHHGVFVIFAVFITQLSLNKKILSRNNLALFSPFLVMMLGWFAYPPHIASFFGHSTFQPHFYTFLSFDNLLYYPKSFLQVYHSSGIIAVILGVSFIIALKNIKKSETRLFLAHILIGIILLTIKLDNRHRYIVTIIPSIWLLGATQLTGSIDSLMRFMKSKKSKIVSVAIVLSGIFVILYFSSLRNYRTYPEALLKQQFYCDNKLNKAYEFITDNSNKHNHIVVFSSWDYYNSLKGSTIKWNIEVGREQDKNNRINKKSLANFYFFQMIQQKTKGSYEYFIRFLENKNVNVTEYHLLSFMKILDLDAYQEFRNKNEINPFSDKITDFDSLDKSVSCLITVHRDGEEELNLFSEQFMHTQREWREINRERFSDLKIEVTIYVKAEGH
ncbi:ArnT family glycosyltransferase [Acidobacteriota bacterium]